MAQAKTVSTRISDHFASLTDPRNVDRSTYPLINFVAIAIIAVVSGADDFVAIAKFGRQKREWLSKFLDLSKGIPSHDRFNAVLARIKPEEFEKCLLSWITSLHEVTAGQIVAIDGKTLRGSFDKASGKSAIHMVSAWATANHISLGQVVVDEKSNEITAIPKLLKMLDLTGALVTIDAMGCQTEIAQKIVDAGADYCLMVKDNQRKTRQAIANFFEHQIEVDFADTKVRQYFEEDKEHGRREERSYAICPISDELAWLAQRWPGLKAIGVAIRYARCGDKESVEFRYYILSKYLSAKRFAAAVRGHWGIENRLHWQLDVTFQEDKCRIRKGHADTNFSILRRTALSLLKNHTTSDVGIKNRRLQAAWNDDYRAEIFFQ